MCFGLCIHSECVARCQMQADNILKETLQCCILTSNYSNVYSNQRHNRWRGMNLWQAGTSCSSFSCGFWCLMTASEEELIHLSVSHIKEVLSAAEKGPRMHHKCAEMHALVLLKCNLQKQKKTSIIDFIYNYLLWQRLVFLSETAPCKL